MCTDWYIGQFFGYALIDTLVYEIMIYLIVEKAMN